MRKILFAVIIITCTISLIFLSNSRIKPVRFQKNIDVPSRNTETKTILKELHETFPVISVDNTQKVRTEKVYSSERNKEAIIGHLNPERNDNPSDNVFHVTISDIKPGDRAWLEYELFGVDDYTSVCTGINDGVSFGGWFVKINNSWKYQKIEINPELLRKGDNIIRFSVPDHADICYRIRNLQLRLKPADLSERRLVISQPDTMYYNHKYGYISGFVTGKGSERVKINVNGMKMRTD